MELQRFYADFKQGKRPKLAATPEDQPAHARTSQDLAQPATTFSRAHQNLVSRPVAECIPD